MRHFSIIEMGERGNVDVPFIKIVAGNEFIRLGVNQQMSFFCQVLLFDALLLIQLSSYWNEFLTERTTEIPKHEHKNLKRSHKHKHEH